MITIDRQSLDNIKGESYAAWRNNQVKVFLDDKDISKFCIYCNIDAGIAVVVKRTLDSQVIIAGNTIIHEFVVGKITVEH